MSGGVDNTEPNNASRAPESNRDDGSYGITENDLRRYRWTLSANSTPISRRGVLAALAKQKGIDRALLLGLVREYDKKMVRETEVGELFHYHATTRDNLSSICEEGALLSYNELKAKGKPPKNTGSRPDVVQCTRDHYDRQGKLTKWGLGQYAGEVTFVFSPAVMDEPDYEGLTEYPDLPRIPLSKVERVLVNDEADISPTDQIFRQYGHAPVVETRQKWISEHYPQQST